MCQLNNPGEYELNIHKPRQGNNIIDHIANAAWSFIFKSPASRLFAQPLVQADQRKHQRSASLAFVRGSHRWPVYSHQKWPVTRKMFPFDDVIMQCVRRAHAMLLEMSHLSRNYMVHFENFVSRKSKCLRDIKSYIWWKRIQPRGNINLNNVIYRPRCFDFTLALLLNVLLTSTDILFDSQRPWQRGGHFTRKYYQMHFLVLILCILIQPSMTYSLYLHFRMQVFNFLVVIYKIYCLMINNT